MPIVRIEIQAGKSTAYKRALLHGVREAITDVLGVGHERVMQRIVEAQPEDIDVPEIRTERLAIITIAMLAGRGLDKKRELYAAIIKHLGLSPGIAEHDIVVLVNDPAAECFCIGGVLP
jgi:phenylpyruvate tautomerase PptA (4-oxalocrotonate tautomerase family)